MASSVPMIDVTDLGPAGTKSEWKRIDEVYDAESGTWIFRDSAPFSGKEVRTAKSRVSAERLTGSPQTEDAYRDYCFVVKKKYDYNGPGSETKIVIKSVPLRDACAKVIGAIPPVSFHTPQVEVSGYAPRATPC